MSQAETTQSPAQAIERCRGLTTPLSCAMTPVAQQPGFEFHKRLIQQGPYKARDEADHQQQFQTRLQASSSLRIASVVSPLPGRPSFAGTRPDEPELLLIVRMRDGNGHDASLDPLPPPAIPHLTFTEGPPFATDAAW